MCKKFIIVNAYIEKKRSQISNRTLQLKELAKEEQTKPWASRRKEIITIRVEINREWKDNRENQWKQKSVLQKGLTKLTNL